MTAAAKVYRVSAERLRQFLASQNLAERQARRWVMGDTRPRRMPVMTGGAIKTLTIDGYNQARLVGEHHYAVGEFVRTNDVELIRPFHGRSVRTSAGVEYALETDPNALHRLAAMDLPVFHEIYEIVSLS
jgi:hypothetical protein